MDLTQRRRVMLAAGKRPRLPKEYQEVEYIETAGDGNPWIDTGITPSASQKVTAYISFTNYMKSKYIFGYWVQDSQFQAYITYVFSLQWSWANPQVSTSIDIRDLSGLQKIELFSDGQFSYLRLNNSIESQANTSLYTPASLNILLFSAYENGRIENRYCYNNGLRFHRFVVEDNNQPIGDLVPCYRKGDSKPGMYDLIDKAFLANAGTGEFLVGPDVN